jgi:hypothetical protein
MFELAFEAKWLIESLTAREEATLERLAVGLIVRLAHFLSSFIATG